VAAGLVASINRPSGNITGVNFFTRELGAKRLEVLREIVPKAKRIALLFDPASSVGIEANLGDVETAIRAGGQQPIISRASTIGDIETAFATFISERADALLVISSPLFTSRRDQVVALAARHAIPASYSLREFPVAGGLISPASRMRIAKPVSMSGASSKGPNLAICRSCSPLNSNSSLTSRLQRHSASKCRRRCLAAPTR
jgi:putative tryptophan/tyrosine transport system substrate-binding protein